MEPLDKLTLNQTEIAERQLHAAVEFFFNCGDPVAVHTLTAATHEILAALTSGSRDFDLFLEASCILPEKKKEIIDLMRHPQNAFKHAKPGRPEIVEFVPFQTEIMLFDCVRMYKILTGQITAQVHVYNLWFVIRYPQYFHYSADPSDPLHQFLSRHISMGVDPRNLKAFGAAIPALKKMAMFPLKEPAPAAGKK